MSYNTSDCEALRLVAECVSKICGQLSTAGPNADSTFVDTNKSRGLGPFKFGELNCAIPEFEYINRASYWDYQRERMVVRSGRLHKGLCTRSVRKPIKYPANKAIAQRRTIVCPYCKSREIYKWGPRSKTVYDLKFSSAGVKRWVVNYQFDRHKCWQCKKTFMPQRKPWTRSQYGNGLMRFLVFLTIDLQMSQRAAKRLLDQFFSLNISRGSTGRLKIWRRSLWGDLQTNFMQYH